MLRHLPGEAELDVAGTGAVAARDWKASRAVDQIAGRCVISGTAWCSDLVRRNVSPLLRLDRETDDHFDQMPPQGLLTAARE